MKMNFEQVIKGLNIKPSKGAFGYASVTFIKDENENILFDTGSFGVRKVIYEFLQKEKIDKVFISHLHFDHCSNLDLFKDTKIYINSREIENLYNNNEDYDLYKPLLKILDKYNIIKFDKPMNITENVRIVLTYGHTIGHSSLEFVKNNKNILIAGDSIKSLNDYLNNKEFGNAQQLVQYIETKKMIKNKYDIIIPGHSDIIYKDNLKNTEIKLKIF